MRSVSSVSVASRPMRSASACWVSRNVASPLGFDAHAPRSPAPRAPHRARLRGHAPRVERSACPPRSAPRAPARRPRSGAGWPGCRLRRRCRTQIRSNSARTARAGLMPRRSSAQSEPASAPSARPHAYRRLDRTRSRRRCASTRDRRRSAPRSCRVASSAPNSCVIAGDARSTPLLARLRSSSSTKRSDRYRSPHGGHRGAGPPVASICFSPGAPQRHGMSMAMTAEAGDPDEQVVEHHWAIGDGGNASDSTSAASIFAANTIPSPSGSLSRAAGWITRTARLRNWTRGADTHTPVACEPGP